MKLLSLFLRFQTEEGVLRINKGKVTGENAFLGDLSGIEENHESSKDEKTWF